MRDWGRDCWCIGGQDNSCGKRFEWNYPKLPKGYDHKFIFSELGYNLKMTDLQAACGYAQMGKIREFEKIRKNNERVLRKLIENNEELANSIMLHKPLRADMKPCWFGFPITVRAETGLTAVEVSKQLNMQGIMTRPVFSGNIIRQPALNEVEYKVLDGLENKVVISSQTLWVVISQKICEEEMRRIYEALNNVFDLNQTDEN